MFNFFKEIKNQFNLTEDFFSGYTYVNLSGKMLYVEGNVVILQFTKEIISFKVNKNIIVVKGKNLSLKLLSLTTLCIKGIITSVEDF